MGIAHRYVRNTVMSSDRLLVENFAVPKPQGLDRRFDLVAHGFGDAALQRAPLHIQRSLACNAFLHACLLSCFMVFTAVRYGSLWSSVAVP